MEADGVEDMAPKKINLLDAARQTTEVFKPRIPGDVNDSKVNIAEFGEIFDWHPHEQEHDAFLLLSGRTAIAFRDGAVKMGEGDFVVLRCGDEHRPCSLTRGPVVVMFEPARTMNTGNAPGRFAVTQLERLG